MREGRGEVSQKKKFPKKEMKVEGEMREGRGEMSQGEEKEWKCNDYF